MILQLRLSLFFLICLSTATTRAQDDVVELTTQQFRDGIQSGEYDIVVDVRSQSEWDAGHIENAYLVADMNLDMNGDRISVLENCKGCTVAVYCTSGVRARVAANKLVDQGYATPIYNGQGVSQWTGAGFSLVTTAPSISPPCLDETTDVSCRAASPTDAEDDPMACPLVGFDSMDLGDSCECFSGEMLVNERSKGEIAMKYVDLEDELLVSNGVYEPVYMWGHRDEGRKSRFLRFEPMGLELSPAHMVFARSKGAIPAHEVVVGDHLTLADDEGDSVVAAIHTVQRQGVYAPFTKSGRLIVQNVSCSAYVAVLPEGKNTYFRISQHWMAHAFVLVNFYMWNYVTGEAVSQEAVVSSLAVVDMWWGLPRLVRMVLFAPFVIFLVSVLVVNSILNSHFFGFRTFYVMVGVACLYWYASLARKKKTT